MDTEEDGNLSYTKISKTDSKKDKITKRSSFIALLYFLRMSLLRG